MRKRLVLAITGVAAAAVLLLALPLAVVLRNNYRDDELLRLQRDTAAATRQVDVSASLKDPIELPASRDGLGAYDKAGGLVAGDGPPRADAVAVRAIESGRIADSAAGGQFTVAVPLLVHERVAGALRAVRNDDAVSDRTEKAWLALGGLALAIVGLAAGAAALLGRRLADPLERLAALARRLGEGDFSVRAPHSKMPEADEIGEALSATAERLGELLTRERAFSADASHQLRTPLAALRLELEAMQLNRDEPELERMLRQVDRLERTIQTLTTVTRDTDRKPGRTELASLMAAVEERWHGRLAAEGRPLRMGPDQGLVARAAPGVVSEILDVLVDNAQRHGAGVVSVSTRQAPKGTIAIDVLDEGAGISGEPEAIFARGHGSSDGNGHGIGLHLARSLAIAEGGSLVITRAGPSPTFTLFLPGAPRGEAP